MLSSVARSCAARIAAALALFLAACAGPQSASSRAEPAGSHYSLSKAVPGLRIEFRELQGQALWPHFEASASSVATQYVDRKSTLELRFLSEEEAASAELRELSAMLTTLEGLFLRFQEIQADASRLEASGLVGPELEPYLITLRRFDDEQRELERKLRELRILPSEGAAMGAWLAKHQLDVWEGIRAELEARVDLLTAREQQRRSAEEQGSQDQRLVTVHAELDPEVGDSAFLQVPDYYVKAGDTLQDRKENQREAEFVRLQAEFALAKEVVASIEELRAQAPVLEESWKASLRELRDGLRGELSAWKDEVERVLASVGNLTDLPKEQIPDPTGSPVSAAERGSFWKQVEDLRSRLEVGRQLVDSAQALALGELDLEKLSPLLEGFDTFWTGAEDADVELPDLLKSLVRQAPQVLSAELQAQFAQSLASTQTLLEGNWSDTLVKLRERLPMTQQALDSLAKLSKAASTLASLPTDTDGIVPHGVGDPLPPARLDLRRNPVTPGDAVALKVQVWEPSQFAKAQAGDASGKPEETLNFEAEVMKSGWVWSGDAIFVRPFAGDTDFSANASVSYEYRFFDRERPMFWRPGLGFHAAQLSFDSEETVEIGTGINASLWDGLLRLGVGYNLSASDDPEYWFLGFGVISALDKLKSIDDWSGE